MSSSKALKLELDTKSAVFSDFGYSLQLRCGSAPQYISKAGRGQVVIPFSGHTGPHELLRLSILSSIDGLYQTMATATAKINPGATKSRSAVVKFESKTGAFDPFEMTITYLLIDRSRSDNVLDMKHNVCLSVQAKFHGGATPEDLVLRLLDQAENCLGMCNISPQSCDAVMLLSSDVSSSELQLSMAGENSGVSWIPMRWGAPIAWMVPLESNGWIMVTAHLMEGKGQSVMHFSDAAVSVDGAVTSDVLLHLSPLPSQTGSAVVSSSDVRHTEYPPSPADLQHIVDGVKSAPVMSRSEVARGPAKGAYVLASAPSGCSSLVFSHDAIDGQMENSLQLCAVVLRIQPLDLASSSDEGAFSPAVSVLGHAVLSIDPKAHGGGGLSRVLRGILEPAEGKEGGGGGSVSVNVQLSVLTTRPPEPEEPKQSSPDTEISAELDGPPTSASPQQPTGEEESLKSTDKLLFDSEPEKDEADSAGAAEPVEGEKGAAPGPTVEPKPEESADKLDAPAASAVEPAADQQAPSPTPSLTEAPPVGNLNSSGGAAFGSVGFPMNPRHVLSSSSVMTAGGSGKNANSSGALADTLSAEIQAKQRTIDKMSSDMVMKQELYKRIEEENQALKTENSRLKLRIAEAHTALARREQESEDAAKYVQELSANPQAFHHWDRELLVHLIREAGVHIRRLETETLSLRETVDSTEKIRSKYGSVCAQLSELQDAHLTQAKFLQKLKERTSKVKSYEDTIKAQEEVISRMQSVLESQLRSKSAGRSPGVTLSQSLLSRSMPGKKDGDPSAGPEQAHTPKQSMFTEEDPKMKKEIADLKIINERLTNELDIRSRRVESLENQLVSSAHEASKEISKLRTKLLDFELNHADTRPFGSNYESNSFDAGSTVGEESEMSKNSSADRMKQRLMVPFESMSNSSFDQYVQKPSNARSSARIGAESALDEVDDEEDFERFKRSMGSSASKANVSSTASLRQAQGNNINGSSRPSSGASRLESLVKPLGTAGGGIADAYY